jgi:hypothetical protein
LSPRYALSNGEFKYRIVKYALIVFKKKKNTHTLVDVGTIFGSQVFKKKRKGHLQRKMLRGWGVDMKM